MNLKELMALALVLGGWYVLTQVLLPKLGVGT